MDPNLQPITTPSERNDFQILEETIELSKKCPRADAYNVGAILITQDGRTFSGYSRETGEKNHAEEEAIMKALESGCDLKGAIMYSSMEPCSKRKSKDKSCSELIIHHKMAKAVFAASEPDFFVICEGKQNMIDAGISTIKSEELEKKALDVNKHILNP